MIYVEQPSKEFNRNPPVDDALIHKVESDLPFSFPEQYVRFLKWSNGGEGLIGQNAYVILWPLEELLSMNKSYEVERYSAGLFLFGSDGGGEAFAFDIRSGNCPIVSVPFVGMDLSLGNEIAPDFDSF